MSEFDEYESLPTTATATTHMIAGSLAGILEHCVMYPIDSVKVIFARLDRFFFTLIVSIFLLCFRAFIRLKVSN